jgi:four helix bundle protein
MKSYDLKKRSKDFAHRCVKFSVKLPNTFLGNHIKGQLIRCSTSVAANYRATCVAQSKPSFVTKISIVVEEADESLFWLQFIKDEELVDIENQELAFLISEAVELVSIFISSRKTAQNSIKK